MRSTGADYGGLQRYVGQAVPTVLSQLYDRISGERLEAVAALAQRVFDGRGACGRRAWTRRPAPRSIPDSKGLAKKGSM
jgi:hypothetical protein